MKYKNILEEELKNKVSIEWFPAFDTTEILGKIDFTVFPKQNQMFGRTPLLWAEAKTGDFDVVAMFVQLVLTIGKARTFDKTIPPAFLGVFDFKKIAFIPYISVEDIFYQNDFNWNVAPSNHATKEFNIIKERISNSLHQNAHIFDYELDDVELKSFIKNNVANSTTSAKLKIDKNNFSPIYLRWLDVVKPIIDVNWDDLKKANILDSDFYLADLFVDDRDTQGIEDDLTIRDSLFVVFQNGGYKIAKENIKQLFDATISLKNKDTYFLFWKRYKRPPIKEFQDYIIERRDLLVPQDIRERKGAFFTPRSWVELSQKYLTDFLGDNWQEDYIIWDCAAGTGNLLAGLTNKYNIYASTLDQADVRVIHERIDHGANLLKNHVFQFDFLNDDFVSKRDGGKLPDGLYDIIASEEKRSKLIIYINPPYAEATTSRTVVGTGENKSGVATQNKVNEKLKPLIGNASNELFALFMATIYIRMPGAILGQFSTLKFINGSNFRKFKQFFLAEYLCGFVVPANTFDNVKGHFPIGFSLWNTGVKSRIGVVSTDVYDEKGNYLSTKNFYGDLPESINKWIVKFQANSGEAIGLLSNYPPDFQNQSKVFIKIKQLARGGSIRIVAENLFAVAVYFAVRHCIQANWLNDRDQFLMPNEGWIVDSEFQVDCLVFMLFHGQNKISCDEGINHWIPFNEHEVDSKEKFQSRFMSDFFKGLVSNNLSQEVLFTSSNSNFIGRPLDFSKEALEVFNAGKNLWRYYHSKDGVKVNAGLYDIRGFFQGRDTNGKMLSKSNDFQYTQFIAELKRVHTVLAMKLRPTIFKYGFLMD